MDNRKINTTIQLVNYDYLGAIGSTLCMIHCIATPFIFAAQATISSTCSEISPTWWKMVDVLFLVITFFAVYYSSRSTTLKWAPFLFYFLWTFLALLVFNNFVHVINVPHSLMYIPAISLSVLHLYNLRRCRCANESCCSNSDSW